MMDTFFFIPKEMQFFRGTKRYQFISMQFMLHPCVLNQFATWSYDPNDEGRGLDLQ